MLSIWQTRTLARLSQSLEPVFKATPRGHVVDISTPTMVVHTRPSPLMLDALVSLTTAAYQLGLSHEQMRETRVLQNILDRLSRTCFQLVEVEGLRSSDSTSQLLWDLYFLECLRRETGLEEIGKETIRRLQIRVRTYSLIVGVALNYFGSWSL